MDQPTANSEGSTYYVPGEDISHEQETASLAFSHVEDCEPVFLPVSREMYISKENCKGLQILLVEANLQGDTRQSTASFSSCKRTA